MLNRILLDANVILNATFVSQSWSRLVVLALVQQKKLLFVGHQTFNEAVMVARKITAELNKQNDPALFLEQFIREFGITYVLPSSDHVDSNVPKHDHHVVQEAITANATILTSDAKLWSGCQLAGYKAVLPLQAMRSLNGLSLSTTAFGVRPGKHRGSIFARVYPGGWASQQNIGQFTVADFSGRLWLYYCTHTNAWIVDVPEVGRITLETQLAEGVMQTVAVSWDAGKHMRLRASSANAPAEICMQHPLREDITEESKIGIRSDRKYSWYGNIWACVINDRPIGSKNWAELREQSYLTPNPFDSDRLRQAIKDLIR